MKVLAIYGILMLKCFSVQSQNVQNQSNLKSKKMTTNKEKAIAINRAVQNGDVESAAALVTENYIQHTPNVPDGKRGLQILITKIKNKEIPAPKISNVRIFEDGEFVVLHHDVSWPNRKAMFEVFRFENGLAAEHWSGIADHPEKTANGHSMLDGPTEIKDKNLTQKNKELATSFVEAVLIKGQFNSLSDFYHPEIIQHNPFIDNTILGLLRGVEELQKQGISFQIKKIYKVLGEGNFVLVCSEGEFAGKHTAFFDLFRVDKNIIVEHWDVLQEIPEKLAHDNGFFKSSLYKRIGGYDAIAGFVDLAFPRVAANDQLGKYFIGHAEDSKYRQRQLIIDKLSSTLQGPTIYLGRPLESVHKGLSITAGEWDIFMQILTQAMDERGIVGEVKTDFIDVFQNVFRSVTVETEIQR
jgi:predicted SnoaL-like aldol condensation-catalyzing enzyme/truncated hemoglobin YjbI